MIRWMSIPSRKATQPRGRCKPKTGASSSRKEFAPFRSNSSLQSSTPLEIVTLIWKTTGSHTNVFLSPEEAQPSPPLSPHNRGPSQKCHHEEKTAALLITNPQPLVNHARTPPTDGRRFTYMFTYAEWAGDVWTTLTQRSETLLTFSQRWVDFVPSSNFH